MARHKLCVKRSSKTIKNLIQDMKWKQFLLIVSISAGSALASVWGYNKFAHKHETFVQTANGVPVNYAGFFDGKNSSGPADFTKAANAAVQAVVHIKTKIPAKKV